MTTCLLGQCGEPNSSTRFYPKAKDKFSKGLWVLAEERVILLNNCFSYVIYIQLEFQFQRLRKQDLKEWNRDLQSSDIKIKYIWSSFTLVTPLKDIKNV